MLGRDFAVYVVKTLKDCGFQGLWAGGCVRDQLLGRTPKDYDVATDARPEQIRSVFGKRRTIAVGAAFGVITILGPEGAGHVEVATFREDGGYSDGRRPDSVRFCSAELDAQRRDFTINGVFYDPITDEVIDYVEGQKDLEAKMVRAIGNPDDRIAEDKLRMLRAVRFAATYGFEIDALTFDAIRRRRSEIERVSAERITDELRKMLIGPQRDRAIQLLEQSGLLTAILPELNSAVSDEVVFAHVQQRVSGLGPVPVEFPLAFAALLLDVSDRVTEVGAFCRRLRLSNAERKRTEWLVANTRTLLSAKEIAWPTLQRLLVQPGTSQLRQLAGAESRALGDGGDSLALVDEKLNLLPEQLDPPVLLTGDDLKRNGFSPGPRFRQALDAVRDAQLLGNVNSADEALDLAREFLTGPD